MVTSTMLSGLTATSGSFLSACLVALSAAALSDLSASLSAAALSAGTLSAGTLSARSEEHTSELQSQSNLVCRLLLEKKKQDDDSTIFRCCHLHNIRPTKQTHDTAITLRLTSYTTSIDLITMTITFSHLPTTHDLDN